MKLTYSINSRVIEKDHAKSGSGWEEKTTSLDELLKLVTVDGFGFLPALLTHSGKSNEHIKEYQTLCVDIDNSGDQITTIEEAKANPFLQQNAIALWETPSSRKITDKNPRGLERFRILFRLPEPIRICPAGNRHALDEVSRIIKRLNSLLPGADNNVKAGHYFSGTVGGNSYIFDRNNTLDLSQVPALPERVHTRSSGSVSEFTGSPEDSIRNINRWLKFIDSSDYNSWLSVAGCLRNASDFIGEDQALTIFLDWCHKDYPEADDQENTHLFLNLDVGDGGFGKLKELAIDGGYEPASGMAKSDEVDVKSLFPVVEGYTVKKLRVDPPTYEERQTLITELQEALHPNSRIVRIAMEKLYTSEGRIRFNELTNEIEILGKPLPAYEFDVAQIVLDKLFGVLTSNSDAKAAIKNAANQNRYHPVAEYLELCSTTTDDIDLDEVGKRVLGVSDSLSLAMLKAWLVGAVSKVLNEGSTFIEVLTLISPRQGIGKSEFFKSLASPDWFNDSFSQTDGEKDRLLCLHSSWINEISEVDQFASNKKDFKALKGLISTTIDKMRVPYGAVTEKKPRRFVMGATANTSSLFAVDDEQRRFWPIEVKGTTSCGRLDIEWLREHRDEIWGTATRLFKQYGQQAFELTKEQRQAVIQRNAEDFQQASNIADKVIQFLEYHNIGAISTTELLNNVLLLSNPTKGQQMEVGTILVKQGYVKKKNKKKLGHSFTSLYVHPERKYEYDPQCNYTTRALFNASNASQEDEF